MMMWKKPALVILFSFMCLFTSLGYAEVSQTLRVTGTAQSDPTLPDIYIMNVEPTTSAGVTVTATSGTLMSAKITGSGTATFRVTIKNISDKIYVFERVIDGAETGIEDVYNGTDITYELSGIIPLSEVGKNGGTRTFDLTIHVPSGVTTNNYVLLFNFLEKQSTKILPDKPPTEEPDPDPDPEPDPDEVHGDFRGLVDVLLDPDVKNSLNNSNMIYDAVYESLTASKRPEEDAPILHCHIKSVSGGTMSELAEKANDKLESYLHFIFMVDETNANRLILYMYYETDCTEEAIGSRIPVYQQIVSLKDGKWVADGTYLGHAIVGEYYGGGSNGKDVLTIDAYSWRAGAVPIDE